MSVEFDRLIGGVPESSTRGLLVGKLLVGGLGVVLFFAGSCRMCSSREVLKGTLPWRTRYPLS